MNTADYIRLFRKRWWIIALVTSVAAVMGLGVGIVSPPRHEAQAMVTVGGYIRAPNPDTFEIRAGVELAQTYAVLARSRAIMDAVIEAENLPLSIAELDQIVSVRVIPNTSLLLLSATSSDPEMAARIANELANQLILNSPSNLTPEQEEQVALVEAEIVTLQSMLEETRGRLTDLNSQIAEAVVWGAELGEPDFAFIADLQLQRDLIIEQINQASGTIADYAAILSELRGRSNSLNVVEEAEPDFTPLGPSKTVIAVLSAVVGGIMAIGGLLIHDYFDDTVSTTEEAQRLAPVIGEIVKFKRGRKSDKESLIALMEPESPAAEGYRYLRAKLVDPTCGKRAAYIITSAGPDEGKTVTAVNLAIIIAAAGHKVLLIDADLRKPRVHSLFDMSYENGLSTLLSTGEFQAKSTGNGSTKSSNEFQFKDLLNETKVPGLWVITSGGPTQNPGEMLGFDLWRKWSHTLLASEDYDVVLFDTPPVLAVSDSLELARATNAPVLLVIEAGKTRGIAAVKANEEFQQLALSVAGIILNGVDSRDRYRSYDYSTQR